jgi:hypothetical protein
LRWDMVWAPRAFQRGCAPDSSVRASR